MIGIFDSGAGGLAALRELRRLCPSEDILFLADTKNAPYGTKSEDEIIRLASQNIKKLSSFGADRVLIACCTASTVYHALEEEERAVSTPIIFPTARVAASLTQCGRIAVIATEHTASSGAFKTHLKSLLPNASVLELAAQPLVKISEELGLGAAYTAAMHKTLRRILLPVMNFGADTLILGCTHFSHLDEKIKNIIKDITTVDSAKIGAREIAKSAAPGSAKTVYL